MHFLTNRVKRTLSRALRKQMVVFITGGHADGLMGQRGGSDPITGLMAPQDASRFGVGRDPGEREEEREEGRMQTCQEPRVPRFYFL